MTAKNPADPGEILVAGPENLEVACGQGSIVIKELQLEGGKRLMVSDFLKGHPIVVGERVRN